MTSSNGNIFHVTDPFEGNPPVTGAFRSQSPVMRTFDVFFDLRLNKRLSTQSRRRWFETPSRSLWRHCNGDNLINGPWQIYCNTIFKLAWLIGANGTDLTGDKSTLVRVMPWGTKPLPEQMLPRTYVAITTTAGAFSYDEVIPNAGTQLWEPSSMLSIKFIKVNGVWYHHCRKVGIMIIIDCQWRRFPRNRV